MTPFEAVTTKYKPLSVQTIEGRQVAIYSYCLLTTKDGATLEIASTARHTVQHVKKIFSGGYGPFIDAFIQGILSTGIVVDLTDPDSLDHLDKAMKEFKLMKAAQPAKTPTQSRRDKAIDAAMGLYGAVTKKGKP